MSMGEVRRELDIALRQVDQSEAAITGCTSIFMRFYANAPEHAARVWFDVMMADSAPAGHLPLVYVCNDVLQKTKRQLGPNYLEQFSPYLAKALGHATRKAEGDPSDKKTALKTRNMVKLWGDRGVYSKRYIMELLSGIDSYKAPSSSTNSTLASSSSDRDDDSENSDFDLDPEENAGESLSFKMPVQVKTSKRKAEDISNPSNPSNDEEEFSMDAFMRTSPSSSNNNNANSNKTPNLDTLQTQVLSLAKNFKKSFTAVAEGNQQLYAGDKQAAQSVFGDDLTQLHSDVLAAHTHINALKKNTILLARNQHQTSKLVNDTLADAKNNIKLDEDELVMCEKLMTDLLAIRALQKTSSKDRQMRRVIEARKEKAKREEEARKKEEEEGLAALQRIKENEKNTEGKVWDPTRKMYVEATEHVDDDSWRR
ncbi:hypothetical protein TrLO_g7718 [Triparma laevis f. longispina]|uniref:CID domain-containing protein n=1 Tax=Triparma laevis f. longispina TaxID=1714387 RepID=A0A9W7AWA1_9STRA|nr:hypothetical protein TrLO_g7718 [Triparma laevis f. longispina]